MTHFKHLLAGALLCSAASLAHAQNAVWLPAPGSGSVSLSYVNQDADQFYIGGNQMMLPFGSITIDTTTLGAQYGLTDALALDAKLPFAKRSSGLGDDSAVGDARLGLTWRALDEFTTLGAPTIALRFGGIFAGDYETQRPDSIGDGASGYEGSVLIGKYLTRAFALRAELGLRVRSKDVPNETFYNLGADYTVAPGLTLSAGYTGTRSSGSLDIGGPGFDPSKFQQVKEERDLVSAGLTYAVTRNVALSANIGKVTSGRNTSKSDVYGLGVNIGF
jgi:hypothetical protein